MRSTENKNSANGMIRTLLVLFVAILMRDFSTDSLNWILMIILGAGIAVVYLISRLVTTKGCDFQPTSKEIEVSNVKSSMYM